MAASSTRRRKGDGGASVGVRPGQNGHTPVSSAERDGGEVQIDQQPSGADERRAPPRDPRRPLQGAPMCFSICSEAYL